MSSYVKKSSSVSKMADSATSKCGCVNCHCGDKCQCGDQCKAKDGCCPCTCVGCDGTNCKCDKAQCFCPNKATCCASKCGCGECSRVTCAI